MEYLFIYSLYYMHATNESDVQKARGLGLANCIGVNSY